MKIIAIRETFNKENNYQTSFKAKNFNDILKPEPKKFLGMTKPSKKSIIKFIANNKLVKFLFQKKPKKVEPMNPQNVFFGK